MKTAKRLLKASVMVCLALWLPAFAGAEEGGSPMIGDSANGTRLYRTNCTVCHGFDGAGRGPALATLKKAPADHRNGSLMNARDNRILFSTIKLGCSGRGCSKAMPAFGESLDTLQLWDLVSYLRSLHLPLIRFFPAVDQYVVKEYTLGKMGNEDFQHGQMGRLKKHAGKLSARELKQTVFTLFKADERRASPELVAQEPRLLARLTKKNKLGYVMFTELIGPRKRKVPVGLALGLDYSIKSLVTTIDDSAVASEYNERFAKYVGQGKRGDAPKFNSGRDKVSKIFDRAVKRTYAIAVEAANCYELEERERSWADGTF